MVECAPPHAAPLASTGMGAPELPGLATGPQRAP